MRQETGPFFKYLPVANRVWEPVLDGSRHELATEIMVLEGTGFHLLCLSQVGWDRPFQSGRYPVQAGPVPFIQKWGLLTEKLFRLITVKFEPGGTVIAGNDGFPVL